MFDLESAIREWRKSLRKNPALEDGTIAELESHLRDRIDLAEDEGLISEEAFEKAILDLGSPDDIGAEYYKTDTRHRSGRPPWQTSRWMPALARNYVKIALRNIRRNRLYASINILGLAVGMAVCILLLLWVQDELRYDRFQENGKDLYRIITTHRNAGESFTQAGSPAPLGAALLESVPGVVDYTRVQSGWSGWNLHLGDQRFMEENLACADPSFFTVFSFPFIAGDPATALRERYSIVLTESLAKKCFGEEDPMGRVVQMSEVDMTVTGVIEDVPRHSHLQFDYVFPMVNMTDWRESRIEDWDYSQFATYLRLDPRADTEVLTEKIDALVGANLPGVDLEFRLQPFHDIHLRSSSINTWMLVYPNPGNITYVTIFSSIAFCVLLLACINFMNLTTARSSLRIREVGLRKVVGARRRDLIRQFFSETVLLSVFGFLLALLLVYLVMPTFQTLSGKPMSFDSLCDGQILLGLLGVVLLTGLVAGSYPALTLSAFRPISVFQAAFSSRKGSGALRKLLVVGQFSFTILLVAAALVITFQLRYIRNKDLGLSKENIVQFARYGQYYRDYEGTKASLLQNPDVVSVCRGFPPRHSLQGTTDVDWSGKDPEREVILHSDIVGFDYEKTFGLKMAAGRFYSAEFSTDPEGYVLNETAVRMMGLENPVGERITIDGHTGEILGVVKDYHGGSLHHMIQPKLLKFGDGFHMIVRYAPGSESRVLPFLEEKWKAYVPGHPFRYEFFDVSVDSKYGTERRVGGIVGYFTGITVFIACLGLFGLSSFMAERRTKEVGVRKVLGGSVPAIVLLLSREYLKWVLAANVIALPAAWLLMNRWLSNFAYRFDFNSILLGIAGTAALLIAVLTVSAQSIRAARANPVDSLRYE